MNSHGLSPLKRAKTKTRSFGLLYARGINRLKDFLFVKTRTFRGLLRGGNSTSSAWLVFQYFPYLTACSNACFRIEQCLSRMVEGL